MREVCTSTGALTDVQSGCPHGTPYVVPRNAWPALKSAPAPADHDGLPDAWETAHKLNPKDAADRAKVGPGGYSMLEVY